MAEHQEQSLCGYELEAVIRRMSACCREKTVCTFCLDGSGSVTPGDFRVMTNFVATAMDSLKQMHPTCKVRLPPPLCFLLSADGLKAAICGRQEADCGLIPSGHLSGSMPIFAACASFWRAPEPALGSLLGRGTAERTAACSGSKA